MKPCDLCKDTGRLVVPAWVNPNLVSVCSCAAEKPDILDGIAFRAMTEKQTIDRIVYDFLGPSSDDSKAHREVRCRGVSRERVEAYVARLVAVYGSKLGGLTRTRLVGKVMTRMEARSRKRASADWAAYIALSEHQNT